MFGPNPTPCAKFADTGSDNGGRDPRTLALMIAIGAAAIGLTCFLAVAYI
jgi:hypothetical protein